MSNSVTNYLSNVMKSVKFAAIEVIEEQMPITSNFVTQNKEVVKQIFRDVLSARQTLLKTTGIQEISIFKHVNNALKNIKTDLKSGVFYHDDRGDPMAAMSALGSIMEGMGGEGMGDMMSELNAILSGEGDDDEEYYGDEEQPTYEQHPEMLMTRGDALVASAIFKSQSRASNCIGNVIARVHEHDVMDRHSIYHMQFQQSEKAMMVQKTGWTTMVDGFNKIIEFNNEVMRTHATNSQKFYEEMLRLTQDNNSILKQLQDIQQKVNKFTLEAEKSDNDDPDKENINYESLFQNGLNFAAYKDIVAKRIAKTPLAQLSVIVKTIPLALMNFAEKPLHEFAKQVVKGVIGGQLMYAMKRFDQVVETSIMTGLAKLADYGKRAGTGIKGEIAKILGIKLEQKSLSSVDTSKFHKDSLSWNGIAQKALVEIIPGHLSRIEASLTGNGERYYDYDKGKWLSMEDLKLKLEQIDENIANIAMSPVDDKINQVYYMLEQQQKKGTLSKPQKEEYEGLLKKAIQGIVKHGYVDPSHFQEDPMFYGAKSREDPNSGFLYAFINQFNDFDKKRLTKSIYEANVTKNRQLEYAGSRFGDPIGRLADNSLNNMVTARPGTKAFDITTPYTDLTQLRDEKGKSLYDYQDLILMELYKIRNLGGMNGGGGSGGGSGNGGPSSDPEALKEIERKIEEQYRAGIGSKKEVKKEDTNDDFAIGILAEKKREQERIEENRARAKEKRLRAYGSGVDEEFENTLFTNEDIEITDKDESGNDRKRKLSAGTPEWALYHLARYFQEANQRVQKRAIRHEESTFFSWLNPDTWNWMKKGKENYHELPDGIDPDMPFLDQLLKAGTIGQKFDVIRHNIDAFRDAPTTMLASVLGKAEEAIDYVLFSKESGIDPKTGKPIHGVFDKLVAKLEEHSEKANGFLDSLVEGVKDLFKEDGLLGFVGNWIKDQSGVDIKNLGSAASGEFSKFVNKALQGPKSLGIETYQGFMRVLGDFVDKDTGRLKFGSKRNIANDKKLVSDAKKLIDAGKYLEITEDQLNAIGRTPDSDIKVEDVKAKIEEEKAKREREAQAAREAMLHDEEQATTDQQQEPPEGAAYGLRSAFGKKTIAVSPGEAYIPADGGKGITNIPRYGFLKVSPGDTILNANENIYNPRRGTYNLESQAKNEQNLINRTFSGQNSLSKLASKFIDTYAEGGTVGENQEQNKSKKKKKVVHTRQDTDQLIETLAKAGFTAKEINKLIDAKDIPERSQIVNGIIEEHKKDQDFNIINERKMKAALGWLNRVMIGIEKGNENVIRLIARGVKTDESGNIVLGDTSRKRHFKKVVNDRLLGRVGYKERNRLRAAAEEMDIGDLISSDERIDEKKFSAKEGPITGIRQFINQTFGTDPKKAAVLSKDFLMDNAFKIGKGGTIGALLGTVFPLGGPLMTAIVGAGYETLKNNESINEYLFGKLVTDKNGKSERDNSGLFSKATQEAFNKYAPGVKKWGLLGAIGGLILPFGPLGGAVIGAGASILNNNARMQEVLFGKEGGLLNEDRKKRLKKALPHITAATLGTFFLGPFGLLGSAAIGTGLGLLSTTEMFKKLMLGPKGTDGTRRGGLAGTIRDQIVNPLKLTMDKFRTDFADWFKDKLFNPVADGMKKLGRVSYSLGKSLMTTMGKKLGSFFYGRMSGFLPKFIVRTVDSLLEAVRKSGGLFQFLMKKLLKRPLEWIAEKFQGAGNAAEELAIKHGFTQGYNAKEAAEIYNRMGTKDRTSTQAQATRTIANMNDEQLAALNRASSLYSDAVTGKVAEKIGRRQNQLIDQSYATIEDNASKALEEGKIDADQKAKISLWAKRYMNEDTFKQIVNIEDLSGRKKALDKLMSEGRIPLKMREDIANQLITGVKRYGTLKAREEESKKGTYLKGHMDNMRIALGLKDISDEELSDLMTNKGIGSLIQNEVAARKREAWEKNQKESTQEEDGTEKKDIARGPMEALEEAQKSNSDKLDANTKALIESTKALENMIKYLTGLDPKTGKPLEKGERVSYDKLTEEQKASVANAKEGEKVYNLFAEALAKQLREGKMAEYEAQDIFDANSSNPDNSISTWLQQVMTVALANPAKHIAKGGLNAVTGTGEAFDAALTKIMQQIPIMAGESNEAANRTGHEKEMKFLDLIRNHQLFTTSGNSTLLDYLGLPKTADEKEQQELAQKFVEAITAQYEAIKANEANLGKQKKAPKRESTKEPKSDTEKVDEVIKGQVEGKPEQSVDTPSSGRLKIWVEKAKQGQEEYIQKLQAAGYNIDGSKIEGHAFGLGGLGGLVSGAKSMLFEKANQFKEYIMNSNSAPHSEDNKKKQQRSRRRPATNANKKSSVIWTMVKGIGRVGKNYIKRKLKEKWNEFKKQLLGPLYELGQKWNNFKQFVGRTKIFLKEAWGEIKEAKVKYFGHSFAEFKEKIKNLPNTVQEMAIEQFAKGISVLSTGLNDDEYNDLYESMPPNIQRIMKQQELENASGEEDTEEDDYYSEESNDEQYSTKEPKSDTEKVDEVIKGQVEGKPEQSVDTPSSGRLKIWVEKAKQGQEEYIQKLQAAGYNIDGTKIEGHAFGLGGLVSGAMSTLGNAAKSVGKSALSAVGSGLKTAGKWAWNKTKEAGQSAITSLKNKARSAIGLAPASAESEMPRGDSITYTDEQGQETKEITTPEGDIITMVKTSDGWSQLPTKENLAAQSKLDYKKELQERQTAALEQIAEKLGIEIEGRGKGKEDEKKSGLMDMLKGLLTSPLKFLGSLLSGAAGLLLAPLTKGLSALTGIVGKGLSKALSGVGKVVGWLGKGLGTVLGGLGKILMKNKKIALAIAGMGWIGKKIYNAFFGDSEEDKPKTKTKTIAAAAGGAGAAAENSDSDLPPDIQEALNDEVKNRKGNSDGEDVEEEDSDEDKEFKETATKTGVGVAGATAGAGVLGKLAPFFKGTVGKLLGGGIGMTVAERAYDWYNTGELKTDDLGWDIAKSTAEVGAFNWLAKKFGFGDDAKKSLAARKESRIKKLLDIVNKTKDPQTKLRALRMLNQLGYNLNATADGRVTKIITKVKGALESFKNVVLKFVPSDQKVMRGLNGFFEKVTAKLKPDVIGPLLKKLSSRVLATMLGPIGYGISIVLGVREFMKSRDRADEIFNVPQGSSTSGMKIIAGIAGALPYIIPGFGALLSLIWPTDWTANLLVSLIGSYIGADKETIDKLRTGSNKEQPPQTQDNSGTDSPPNVKQYAYGGTVVDDQEVSTDDQEVNKQGFVDQFIEDHPVYTGLGAAGVAGLTGFGIKQLTSPMPSRRQDTAFYKMGQKAGTKFNQAANTKTGQTLLTKALNNPKALLRAGVYGKLAAIPLAALASQGIGEKLKSESENREASYDLGALGATAAGSLLGGKNFLGRGAGATIARAVYEGHSLDDVLNDPELSKKYIGDFALNSAIQAVPSAVSTVNNARSSLVNLRNAYHGFLPGKYRAAEGFAEGANVKQLLDKYAPEKAAQYEQLKNTVAESGKNFVNNNRANIAMGKQFLTSQIGKENADKILSMGSKDAVKPANLYDKISNSLATATKGKLDYLKYKLGGVASFITGKPLAATEDEMAQAKGIAEKLKSGLDVLQKGLLKIVPPHAIEPMTKFFATLTSKLDDPQIIKNASPRIGVGNAVRGVLDFFTWLPMVRAVMVATGFYTGYNSTEFLFQDSQLQGFDPNDTGIKIISGIIHAILYVFPTFFRKWWLYFIPMGLMVKLALDTFGPALGITKKSNKDQDKDNPSPEVSSSDTESAKVTSSDSSSPNIMQTTPIQYQSLLKYNSPSINSTTEMNSAEKIFQKESVRKYIDSAAKTIAEILKELVPEQVANVLPGCFENISSKLTTDEKLNQFLSSTENPESLVRELSSHTIDETKVKGAFLNGSYDTNNTLGVTIAQATTSIRNFSGIVSALLTGISIIKQIMSAKEFVELCLDNLSKPLGFSKVDINRLKQSAKNKEKSRNISSKKLSSNLEIYNQSGDSKSTGNTTAIGYNSKTNNTASSSIISATDDATKKEVKAVEQEDQKAATNNTTTETSTWDTVKQTASSAWDKVKSGASWIKNKLFGSSKYGEGRLEDKLEYEAYKKNKTKPVLPTSGLLDSSKFVSLNNKLAESISFNKPGDTKKQTLKSSGCGEGTIANVAASQNTPIEMSKIVKEAKITKETNGGTTDTEVERQLSKSGLDTKHINGLGNAYKAMKNGESLAVMGKYGSSTPHWMSVTGMSKDGKYAIVQDSDSNTPNRLYDFKDTIKNSSIMISAKKGFGKRGAKSKYGRSRKYGRSKYGLGELYDDDIQAKTDFAYSWLTSEGGLSPAGAAAGIGNMMVESGGTLDPHVVEYGIEDPVTGKVHEPGDGGEPEVTNTNMTEGNGQPGYGIFQFTSPGLKKILADYAQSKGISSGSIQAQLGAWKEAFENPDSEFHYRKPDWDKMKGDGTPEDLAYIWCEKLEIPGVPHLEQRQAEARKAYDYYKDKVLTNVQDPTGGGRVSSGSGASGSWDSANTDSDGMNPFARFMSILSALINPFSASFGGSSGGGGASSNNTSSTTNIPAGGKGLSGVIGEGYDGGDPMGEPYRMSVHHTAGTNETVESINKGHQDNGWACIGYHFVIYKDGSIHRGRKEKYQGAHTQGYNTGSLGISLVGNFEESEPTSQQLASLTQLLADLGNKYNIPLDREHIKGHGEWDVGGTACPGKNLRSKLDDIVAKAAEVAKGASTSTATDSKTENKEGQSKYGLGVEPPVLDIPESVTEGTDLQGQMGTVDEAKAEKDAAKLKETKDKIIEKEVAKEANKKEPIKKPTNSSNGGLFGKLGKALTAALDAPWMKSAIKTLFGDNFNPFSGMMGGLFGGNNGSSSTSSSSSNSSTAIGVKNVEAGRKYAESMVGQPGFGNNGCTTFVREYLNKAEAPMGQLMTDPTPVMDQVKKAEAECTEQPGDRGHFDLMWVPTIEHWAKQQNYWKDVSQGGSEGDICVTNNGGHVIIADGKGGAWGNSSSTNTIKYYPSIDQAYGSTTRGYVTTGVGNSTVSKSDGPTRSEAEMLADGGSSNTSGFGKFGLSKYGLGEEDSTATTPQIDDLSSRKKYTWDWLVDKGKGGLNTAAASGIMANIETESGGTFDPTIVEGGDHSPTSEEAPRGVGYGLVQYTDESRRQALESFSKNANLSSGSLDGQLGFMKEETTNGAYSGVWNKVNQQKDPVEAARIWMDEFEAPDPAYSHWEDRRKPDAQKYFDAFAQGKFEEGVAATSGGSSTSSTSNSSGGMGGLFGKLGKALTAALDAPWMKSAIKTLFGDNFNPFSSMMGGLFGGNNGSSSTSSSSSNTVASTSSTDQKAAVPTEGNAKDAMQKALGGAPITSPYGQRELGGKADYHNGIDYGIDEGTPLPALVDAVVDECGTEASGYGNYVVLKDTKGNYHIYGHLSDNTKVSAGQQVTKGTIIGLSGNTGASTGAHLHYGIYDKDHPACLEHKDPSEVGSINPSSYSVNGLSEETAGQSKYGLGEGEFQIKPKFTRGTDAVPEEEITEDNTLTTIPNSFGMNKKRFNIGEELLQDRGFRSILGDNVTTFRDIMKDNSSGHCKYGRSKDDDTKEIEKDFAKSLETEFKKTEKNAVKEDDLLLKKQPRQGQSKTSELDKDDFIVGEEELPQIQQKENKLGITLKERQAALLGGKSKYGKAQLDIPADIAPPDAITDEIPTSPFSKTISAQMENIDNMDAAGLQELSSNIDMEAVDEDNRIDTENDDLSVIRDKLRAIRNNYQQSVKSVAKQAQTNEAKFIQGTDVPGSPPPPIPMEEMDNLDMAPSIPEANPSMIESVPAPEPTAMGGPSIAEMVAAQNKTNELLAAILQAITKQPVTIEQTSVSEPKSQVYYNANTKLPENDVSRTVRGLLTAFGGGGPNGMGDKFLGTAPQTAIGDINAIYDSMKTIATR